MWDTTSVPNGRYFVRVVASDTPSNSPATALTGAMESTAFEIDNTPPAITVTSVRREGTRVTIAFDVRDANSAVQKADYSLDGDRWQTIYPKDGIADSRFEQFELVLEGDAGARGVILRAADALNNVASARGEAPTRSRQAVVDVCEPVGALERRFLDGSTRRVGNPRWPARRRTRRRTQSARGSGVCTVVTTISHTMLTATARPTGVCAGANRD